VCGCRPRPFFVVKLNLEIDETTGVIGPFIRGSEYLKIGQFIHIVLDSKIGSFIHGSKNFKTGQFIRFLNEMTVVMGQFINVDMRYSISGVIFKTGQFLHMKVSFNVGQFLGMKVSRIIGQFLIAVVNSVAGRASMLTGPIIFTSVTVAQNEPGFEIGILLSASVNSMRGGTRQAG